MRQVILKRILSTTLALLMLISFPLYTSAANDSFESADTWAYEGIKQALDKGFIPSDLQNNYKNVITRAEFCRMAVKYLEYATGKTIEKVLIEKDLTRRQDAFSDTNDADILAAYALGIINGTVAPTAAAPGMFTPNGELNRQQAATMIMNVCKAIGMKTENPPISDFVDLNDADAWARTGINFVRANGIMGGTGTTVPTFSPMQAYTRQQSIMTFNNIKVVVENKPKPTDTPIAKVQATDKPLETSVQAQLKNVSNDKGVVWASKAIGDIYFTEAFIDYGEIKPLIIFCGGFGSPADFNLAQAMDTYALQGFHAVAIQEAGGGNSKRYGLQLDLWIETVGDIDTVLDYYRTSGRANADSFALDGEIIPYIYGVSGKHTPSAIIASKGFPDLMYFITGAKSYRGTAIKYEDGTSQFNAATVTDEMIAKAKEYSAINHHERFVNIPIQISEDDDADIPSVRTFVDKLKKAGGTVQTYIRNRDDKQADLLLNISFQKNYMDFTAPVYRNAKLSQLYPDTKKAIPLSNGKYNDEELARTVALGYGATQSIDSNITFEDFMKMLDKTVELADKSKLTTWQKKFPEARKSNEIITRYEAMELVLYCAEALGDAYTKFNYEGDLGKAVQTAQGGSDNVSFFNSIWEKGVGIKDFLNNLPIVNGKFADGYKPHPCTSIDYSVGRVSLVSKKPLFEYDTNKKIPLRPSEPLTYTEGLLAALRLYESVPQ